MTRKQAIFRTIEILNSVEIDNAERTLLAGKLISCANNLPLTHWSKDAIFDACEQFVLDHGRIYTTDFGRPELPSRPTIQNRFKMSAAEFRDKYYPLTSSPTKGAFRNKTVDEWKELFISDFHRIKPVSSLMYNQNRAPDLPTWNTVAYMFNIKCWSELLLHCNLAPYKKTTNKLRTETYSVSTISKSELELKRISAMNN